MPALLWADKVLDRLSREGPGTGPDPESPAAQLAEPLSDDLGDRLLALVAEANLAGIDPEQALRDAIRRLF